MPRSRFSPQEKLEIVKEYLGGNTSYIKLVRKYSIDAVSYTHLDVYKRQAKQRYKLLKND